MSLSQVAELVIACIISAGGIGGIVVGVIKFSSDIIAERMAAKYELKLCSFANTLNGVALAPFNRSFPYSLWEPRIQNN